MAPVPYLHEMPKHGNSVQKKNHVAEKTMEKFQQSIKHSDLHRAGFCLEYQSGKWMKDLRFART
jgi:hypothetical protein